ncbi:MAG: LacI family DNA-binding transcriptional regulator [Verrucomicrobiota bacterium]
MTTIADIALKMRISSATVSRALNQSRLVDPVLVEKIHHQAEQMGYKKRKISKHRGRSILNIKLILPRHIEPERSLFYDFASLIEGIQSGFKQCGINLVCETSSKDYKPYPHKKGGDINGFIFAFHRPSEDTLKQLRKNKTPFVVLNRDIPGIPCLASENSLGMNEIVSHLFNSRGKKLKPAFVTLDGLGQIHEERLNGVDAACKQLGIVFNPNKDTYAFPNINSVTNAKVLTLSNKYNALICINDIIGTVVLSELDRLGVAVPKAISVTGFDDSPVRQLSRPLLTTVSMPILELARAAATGLEQEIINQIPQKPLHRVVGKFIIGESS